MDIVLKWGEVSGRVIIVVVQIRDVNCLNWEMRWRQGFIVKRNF